MTSLAVQVVRDAQRGGTLQPDHVLLLAALVGRATVTAAVEYLDEPDHVAELALADSTALKTMGLHLCHEVFHNAQGRVVREAPDTAGSLLNTPHWGRRPAGPFLVRAGLGSKAYCSCSAFVTSLAAGAGSMALCKHLLAVELAMAVGPRPRVLEVTRAQLDDLLLGFL